jgi:uroporphyrinogen-III synthase
VIPLVVLRPEPGASATAGQARGMGLEVRKIPLFEIRPLAWVAPDPTGFDGLIVTSANAVRHGGPELAKLRGLPVHAVGAATAAAARDAGFTVATVGEGGASALDLPAGERLLHLAGHDHLPSGAAMTIAVYEAAPLAAPPGLDELSECVVAVHSPRAGGRLAELVQQRSGIAIASLSAAAADACGDGWRSVEAAAEPSDSALLALAARLCETPRP